MPIDSALRFRVLLGVAKQIIFIIDKFSFPVRLPYRPAGVRVILVPEIGESVEISTGTHGLGGWFVAPEGRMSAAVLIFHGLGDQLPYWRRVQSWLVGTGTGSLVFSYSGYPGSGGTTTPANLARDAQAAYAWLVSRLAPGTPIFLLGFSLGSGLATEVAGELRPAPAGLILCEAFTSLREAARRIASPLPILGNLLPDVWRTRHTIRLITIPILVIHSTGDALFPVSMAEEIHAAGRDSSARGAARVELKVVDGYAHNAPYLQVPEDYWAAIQEFIAGAAS